MFNSKISKTTFIYLLIICNTFWVHNAFSVENEQPQRAKDRIFENYSSDSFPHNTLRQLIKHHENQLLLSAKDEYHDQCNTVYEAILNNKVEYIEPEWEINDFNNPRLEEFKTCYSHDDLPEKSIEIVEKEPFGHGYNLFYFNHVKDENWKAFKKYNTTLNDENLTWLEVVHVLDGPSKKRIASLKNILPDQCLEDKTKSIRVELEIIRRFMPNNELYVSLVKNGLFKFNNQIYSFIYTYNPIVHDVKLKIHRFRNFSNREEFVEKEREKYKKNLGSNSKLLNCKVSNKDYGENGVRS